MALSGGVEGIKVLISKMSKIQAETGAKWRVNISVNYATPYAVYVHENTAAIHPVGQAKYLTEPMDIYKEDIARIVANALKRGMTTEEALIRGAQKLFWESQVRCPIDTGDLRASAYIAVDSYEA